MHVAQPIMLWVVALKLSAIVVGKRFSRMNLQAMLNLLKMDCNIALRLPTSMFAYTWTALSYQTKKMAYSFTHKAQT